MSKATEEVQSALSRLLGHFEAKAEDAQDVKEYKEVMLNGFSQLGADMQALNKAQRSPSVAIYEHYKGGHYNYLGLATQESDGTPLALYRSVDTQTIFARPASEFFSEVMVDGVMVPRFRVL